MTALPLPTGTLDLARRVLVRPDGERVHLTEIEARLLGHLHHAEGAVDRDELLREVWGYARTSRSRACDAAVRRLREKIELDPSRPEVLLTIHGSGYRLVSADRRPEPVRPAGGTRQLAFGTRTADLDRAHVDGPDGRVPLTGNEVALLEHLAGGAAVPGDRLARAVWGGAHGRPLASAVSRLRRKIEDDPERPRFLVTRGRAYRLEADAPAPPDLVGRDDLLRRVRESRSPVVMTGPPGVGKTALAAAIARVHGAVWVDASAASGARDLAAAAARALGGSTVDEPLDAVPRMLATRPGVRLVLDEVDRAAHDLVAVAGWGARLVCTTRVRPPGWPGLVLEVPPLSIEHGCALYVARSSRAAPRADVAALVETLDGLPLAIELAAAQSAVLSPGDQLVRLRARGLGVLEDPEHRSLRAAVEASLSRLTPAERETLVRVSLFRTFDVHDAEAVAGPSAAAHLRALARSSLLAPRPAAGSPRFAVLAAIRDGVEAAAPSQERDHARWLGRLGRPEHLRRVRHRDDDVERAFLRDAADDLAAAVPLGDPDDGAACACGAAYAQIAWGRPSDALRTTAEALARDPGPAWADRLRTWRGTALRTLGRDVEALQVLPSGAGDGWTSSMAALSRAIAAFRVGAVADGVAACATGRLAAGASDEPALAAWFAVVEERSTSDDTDRLAERYEAVRLAARPAGDACSEALALEGLAVIATRRAEVHAAVDGYRSALARHGALGPAELIAQARTGLLLWLAAAGDDSFEVEALDEIARQRRTGALDAGGTLAGHLALWYLQRDRPRDARALLRDRLGEIPDVPAVSGARAYLHLRLAEVYLAAGDAPSARVEADRAVAVRGVRRMIPAAALAVRGACRAALGDADAGLADVLAALPVLATQALTHVTGLRYLATVQAARGDRDGVEATLGRARAVAGHLAETASVRFDLAAIEALRG